MKPDVLLRIASVLTLAHALLNTFAGMLSGRSRAGWDRYLGAHGGMISVERFGASAPAEVLLREYGFTVDNVCARTRAFLTNATTEEFKR